MILQKISREQMAAILDKGTMTLQDRFKLASYAFPSLSSFCNDIRPNELPQVNLLEDRNMRLYMNALSTALGMQNKIAFQQAIATYQWQSLVSQLKASLSGTDLEVSCIWGFTYMILSNFASDVTTNGHPKFQGKMPSKMFSFRQQTAEEWFENLLETYRAIFTKVYKIRGFEEAKSYFLASLAYFLYFSQPNNFNIDNCTNEDEAIKKIIIDFCERSDNRQRLSTDQGELLFKNI